MTELRYSHDGWGNRNDGSERITARQPDPYGHLSQLSSHDKIERLRAEHELSVESFRNLTALQQDLTAELLGALSDDHVPTATRGNWTYSYLSSDPGSFRVSRQSGDGLPQVVFDQAEFGQKAYSKLGGFDVSPDGEYILFSIDESGREEYQLWLRHVESQLDIGPISGRTAAGASFSADGTVLYYTDKGWAGAGPLLYRYHLRDGTKRIVQVSFAPADTVRVSLTRSSRFLRITAQNGGNCRIWLLRQNDPLSAPQCVHEGKHALVEDLGADRRVLALLRRRPEATPEVVLLRDDTGTQVGYLVDPALDVVVHKVTAFRKFLALLYSDSTGNHVAIVVDRQDPSLAPNEHKPAGIDTYFGRAVQLEEPAGLRIISEGVNQDWNQGYFETLIRSYTEEPKRTRHMVGDEAADKRISHSSIPPGTAVVDSKYSQLRLAVEVSDGTEIPVTLIWRTSAIPMTADGPRVAPPAVMYAYGAYGVSLAEPRYDPARLPLLDRGVLFVIAHVRGGGEFGEEWHKQGRGLAKRRAIRDFSDAANRLCAKGWLQAGSIVAEGHSAGGLLVAAAVGERPSLFAGVIALAPFVDPLGTLTNADRPLQPTDVAEFGDPLSDPAAFREILTYSPYENVVSGYPPVLAVVGLQDVRVSPMEAAKWVLRLRDAGNQAHLVALDAGHQGTSAPEEQAEQRALELSWILERLKLTGF